MLWKIQIGGLCILHNQENAASSSLLVIFQPFAQELTLECIADLNNHISYAISLKESDNESVSGKILDNSTHAKYNQWYRYWRRH